MAGKYKKGGSSSDKLDSKKKGRRKRIKYKYKVPEKISWLIRIKCLEARRLC